MRRALGTIWQARQLVNSLRLRGADISRRENTQFGSCLSCTVHGRNALQDIANLANAGNSDETHQDIDALTAGKFMA
jgi:hypothetical protein